MQKESPESEAKSLFKWVSSSLFEQWEWDYETARDILSNST